MKAAQAALLARAAILLAAMAAVCLLLAGCGAESTGAAPAKAAATWPWPAGPCG